MQQNKTKPQNKTKQNNQTKTKQKQNILKPKITTNKTTTNNK